MSLVAHWLKVIWSVVPLIFMTGFGYDPGHSIVKARQAGIDLVLFKPFRIDQLPPGAPDARAVHRALFEGAAVDGLFTDFPDRTLRWLGR